MKYKGYTLEIMPAPCETWICKVITKIYLAPHFEVQRISKMLAIEDAKKWVDEDIIFLDRLERQRQGETK